MSNMSRRANKGHSSRTKCNPTTGECSRGIAACGAHDATARQPSPIVRIMHPTETKTRPDTADHPPQALVQAPAGLLQPVGPLPTAFIDLGNQRHDVLLAGPARSSLVTHHIIVGNIVVHGASYVSYPSSTSSQNMSSAPSRPRRQKVHYTVYIISCTTNELDGYPVLVAVLIVLRFAIPARCLQTGKKQPYFAIQP